VPQFCLHMERHLNASNPRMRGWILRNRLPLTAINIIKRLTHQVLRSPDSNRALGQRDGAALLVSKTDLGTHKACWRLCRQTAFDAPFIGNQVDASGWISPGQRDPGLGLRLGCIPVPHGAQKLAGTLRG
jgi:hypothetical protein